MMHNADIETDKTDETDLPSNHDFLEAVFGAVASDARPILVSFDGDPGKVRKSAWFGHPWVHGAAALLESHNNYFSLATFRPDEARNYRRQKKHFVALHAVMLDDIGTKIPAERITLPPSWWIETSSGNFQIGYILADPITESNVADRLMNAIVNAGLCDPGANGPTARLARLPVAANGKHQPLFTCRMTEWQPERRYTIDELVAGLELEIHQPSRPTHKADRQSKADRHDSGNTHDGDTTTSLSVAFIIFYEGWIVLPDASYQLHIASIVFTQWLSSQFPAIGDRPAAVAAKSHRGDFYARRALAAFIFGTHE